MITVPIAIATVIALAMTTGSSERPSGRQRNGNERQQPKALQNERLASRLAHGDWYRIDSASADITIVHDSVAMGPS